MKIILIIIFFLSSIWLVGCGQKQVPQQAGKPDQDTASIVNNGQVNEDTVINRQEYQLGVDALSVKDYAAAKRIFSRFIEKNPALSGAYLNLALIAFNQKEYDISKRFVTRVLELRPEHARAYHLRALLYQQQGDIRLAEKDYLKAIELDPQYTIAHYNLALLYDIFLQELKLAIEHYNQYLGLLDREDEETADWVQHLKNSLANG